MGIPHFVYPFIGCGHLPISNLLAIMNSAAMTLCVQGFVWMNIIFLIFSMDISIVSVTGLNTACCLPPWPASRICFLTLPPLTSAFIFSGLCPGGGHICLPSTFALCSSMKLELINKNLSSFFLKMCLYTRLPGLFFLNFVHSLINIDYGWGLFLFSSIFDIKKLDSWRKFKIGARALPLLQ